MQNREIHQLQNGTLECFEWAEEARSREARNKDPRYQRLLKSRGLDPLSQKKLSSVQSRFLFLDQQINEANHKLDLEWREHLRETKGHGFGGSRRRIEVPTREAVYRALVTNHRILEAQKLAVQRLERDVKELRIKSITSGQEVSDCSFFFPFISSPPALLCP